MPSLVESFSGNYFQQTIRNYCSDLGWRIRDISDRMATLRFDMESGRTYTLFILRYESTLEFTVSSALRFDTDDEIPGFLSTMLLKRSAEKKIGFWCIEELGEKQVFSCMHNAEMQLIDAGYFAAVVRALIRECDALEEALQSLLRTNPVGSLL